MSQKLYTHIPHPHTPKNVNMQQAAERAEQVRNSFYKRFNDNAAVHITRVFSTMALFWLLDIFLIIWMAGNSIGIWHFDPMPFPLLLMLWNIPQLPLLPLLAIGQSILSRKQEIQADETYNTTVKSFHDIEQIEQHQQAQDGELLLHKEMLVQIHQTLLLVLDHLGIEAMETTDHKLPVARIQGHRTSIDEDQLFITLTHAGIKPELLAVLPLETKLLLERQRPHSQEPRHADV